MKHAFNLKHAFPLLLACAALPARAAEPPRVPVIAGSDNVYVLVEVDGTVKTWGRPGAAEGPYLGDGKEDFRDDPAPLPGVEGVANAAVGHQQVLLLMRDGTVLAWGRNNFGEVGTGDDKKRMAPTQVPGLHGIVQVDASLGFSAAVQDDGTVWMWGTNEEGVLANGKSGYKEPYALSPVKVEGLTGVKRIAVNSSVIALKGDGTVWGWGMNKNGELCDGTTEKRLHPVQMKGISNAVDIANIGVNTAVLLADGTVWMCGKGGESVNEDASKIRTSHTTPVKVPGVAGAVSVKSFGGATMVQLRNGTLLGWGNGIFGVLGDGSMDNHRVRPRAPIGLGPVLAQAYYYTSTAYAIKADGTVMVWNLYPDEKVGWITKPMPLFKVKLAN